MSGGRRKGAPEPDELYRAVTRIFGAIIVVFGVVILAVTLVNGGGITAGGFWLGLLFMGLGAGRLYLAFRSQG
jgi:hypothetical protein